MSSALRAYDVTATRERVAEFPKTRNRDRGRPRLLLSALHAGREHRAYRERGIDQLLISCTPARSARYILLVRINHFLSRTRLAVKLDGLPTFQRCPKIGVADFEIRQRVRNRVAPQDLDFYARSRR